MSTRPSRPRLTRRGVIAATTVAVAATALAACGAGGGNSATADQNWATYSGADSAGGADGEAYPQSEGAYGGGPIDPITAPGGVSAAQRSIIQTGYLYGTSADPIAAATDIIGIVEGAGGRVESQSLVTEAEHRHPSADLTTRIPSEELTGALTEIGQSVTVVQSELIADDVTAQVVDLDARIRAKELSIERLESLLADATTTADIIEAEQTLTQRQTELEQLLTQRKGYSDAVEMATIQISITMPDQVPVDPPPGFSGGFTSGWDSLVATVTGALVVVGFLIPWVLALALVGGIVLLIRRGLRARRGPVAAPSVAVATVSAPVPAATSPAPTPAQSGADALPTPTPLGEEAAPSGEPEKG